ncbi:tail needle knob protein [Aeromonas hydrophila]|uniref:tail needle knob protein n=1 Tax=Aeromonas hydrophila TaxID=644 RepID=UPI002B492F63|nr:tail needle knob protein [Aeromonas hydrophila]
MFGSSFLKGPSTPLPARKKSEVRWSGLTGVSIPGDTNRDLVALLKALPAPASGTLAPFFNTTSDKLNVYNDNASVAFKLNLEGSWTGGSTNRSMQLDFVGTNGNRLVASRDVAVTSDVITLATFFSIDKNGFIALSGTKPVIRSNGGTFTVTGVLLVAEQTTIETVISAV